MKDSLELAGADRRDALRQPTAEQIISIEHAKLGRHPGVINDISRTGLRFRSQFCFPCGSQVTLYPPKGHGLAECAVRLLRQRVVNENSHGEPTIFEYGAHFVEQVGTLRHAWFLSLRRAA